MLRNEGLLYEANWQDLHCLSLLKQSGTEYPTHTTCIIWIKRGIRCAGIEVLTPVIMRSTISWDVILCRQTEVHRRFRGKYCLHLRNRRGRNQQEIAAKQGCLTTAFYSSTILKKEVIHASEKSVRFYCKLWRYVTEGSILQWLRYWYSLCADPIMKTISSTVHMVTVTREWRTCRCKYSPVYLQSHEHD